MKKLKKLFLMGVAGMLLAPLSFAVEAVHAVHGTISRIDSTAKTIVVKTADGTEHTLRFVGKTVVHGTEATATDTFHGLKAGSEVVAHYTAKGTENTAAEVDKVGKDGMRAVDGTITELDRGGKKLAVKTADGSEQTFKLADHAAEDAGKDVGKATEKSAKVTVYYTEDAGKKIAHFFENH
jgi:hypothetical protein